MRETRTRTNMILMHTQLTITCINRDVTGPNFLTALVEGLDNRSGVVILPSDFFYPVHFSICNVGAHSAVLQHALRSSRVYGIHRWDSVAADGGRDDHKLKLEIDEIRIEPRENGQRLAPSHLSIDRIHLRVIRHDDSIYFARTYRYPSCMTGVRSFKHLASDLESMRCRRETPIARQTCA